MHFSKLLKNHRTDKDLTQDEFADLLRIGRSTYRQIEQENLSSNMGGSLLRGMAPYFQHIDGGLDLLLGLFGEFGIDIEKLRDDFGEAEWVYLPGDLPKIGARIQYITSADSRDGACNYIGIRNRDSLWESIVPHINGGKIFNHVVDIVCWRYIANFPRSMRESKGGQNDT